MANALMSKIFHKIIYYFLILICLNYALTVHAAPESTQTTNNSTINFLSIADIHFDPFSSCNTTPCTLILKLNGSPVKAWPMLFKQYDTALPRYRYDTNYTLLQKSL